jgi:hypothetical protein
MRASLSLVFLMAAAVALAKDKPLITSQVMGTDTRTRQFTYNVPGTNGYSTTVASLGGDVASVQEDKAQMKGTLKTTENEGYTVHEITAPGNTVVKEYVSPAGKVFAITWRGQFIPNMQQLLRTHFDQYAQAAKAQRESHPGHRPLNIQQPELVFQNGGHMRSYVGRAYVPDMVPQGVNVDALQ